jgi:hypothetical protein
VQSIAREASAAPAASFKSASRNVGIAEAPVPENTVHQTEFASRMFECLKLRRGRNGESGPGVVGVLLLSFLVDVNLLPSLGAVNRSDTVDIAAFKGRFPAWILLERRAV